MCNSVGSKSSPSQQGTNALAWLEKDLHGGLVLSLPDDHLCCFLVTRECPYLGRRINSRGNPKEKEPLTSPFGLSNASSPSSVAVWDLG